MGKKTFLYSVVILSVYCFFGVQNSQASTEVRSDINEATVWKKENSPYIILKTYFKINAPLTIEPGVVIKSANYYPAMMEIQVNADITAVGTSSEKIVFTTVTDNEYGGDTSAYSAWWNKDTVVGRWKGIVVYNGPYRSIFENVVITYAETAIKQYWSGYDAPIDGFVLKNSEIKNNKTGINITQADKPVIENNSIHDNGIGIMIRSIQQELDYEKVPVLRNNSIYNNEVGLDAWATAHYGFWSVIDARENWWGDPSGPYFPHWDQSKANLGKGDRINGLLVMFDPWLGKDPTVGCQENCFSNVLFLPGIQASRLYRKDGSAEDRLWEPNRNEDVRQLYLDQDGKSVDDGIYTRGVIDEIYGFTDNIYDGFMQSMDAFVAEGNINEWEAFPYDWRMPLEEIVDNGTKLEDGSVTNVIEQIREMAKNSKTGKVSLVGHSNGGLLAKVILDRLEKSGEVGLVDRLIMVGTPQIGTPKAVAGLLHGDGTNLMHGLILNKKIGRGFAENMVGAYNLLPSKKYFDIVQSPVIEFDSDVESIYDFLSIYGKKIDSFGEFKSFLLGDNGEREEPDAGDTDSPNVLKNNLLSQSNDLHNDLLDTWQAPEGMEVVQIAGWGLDTISGIRYDDCDSIFCPDNLSNLDRSLIFTQDGDGTVVVPSAISTEVAEEYYLNINRYNRFVNLKIDRSHSDILEIKSAQDFIKNIIRGEKTPTEYISTEKPEVKDEDRRLRYRMHSPVAVHLYDSNGNHTGIIENPDPNSDLRLYEQQIPNSYYLEFGEGKYLGSDGSIQQKVSLIGEDLGTFTFEIDEIVGNDEVRNTTFENIPVIAGMKAEIIVSDSVEEMKVDIEGDGETDMVLHSGEAVTEGVTLELLEKIISSLDIDNKTIERVNNKIGNARKQFEKGNQIAGRAMLENVKHDIEVFSREQTPEKLRIPKDDAEKLILIISRIQSNK